MATNNSTTSSTGAQGASPTALLQAAEDLCIRLQSFFDLAEREIEESNNTEFDHLEFLVKGAKADVFEFSGLLSKTVDSEPEQIEGEEPPSEEATASDAGTDLHDLACELSGEMAYLCDFIELADDQATNHCSDGKTVALLDAAVTRVKRVRELADAAEIGACRGGGAE